jgi:hypothetical protein
MALSKLWRQRLCLAKTKTPPPFGSGVQEIRAIELEPDCHATQQQRVQQLKVQTTIHAPIGSGLPPASQFVFCCSQANRFGKVATTNRMQTL